MQVDDRIAFRGGTGLGDQGTVLKVDDRERFVILDVLLDSGARIQILECPDWALQIR